MFNSYFFNIQVIGWNKQDIVAHYLLPDCCRNVNASIALPKWSNDSKLNSHYAGVRVSINLHTVSNIWNEIRKSTMLQIIIYFRILDWGGPAPLKRLMFSDISGNYFPRDTRQLAFLFPKRVILRQAHMGSWFKNAQKLFQWRKWQQDRPNREYIRRRETRLGNSHGPKSVTQTVNRYKLCDEMYLPRQGIYFQPILLRPWHARQTDCN